MPSLFHRALGHLVSCRETSHLLSRLEDGPVSAWDRIRLNWHLAVCDMCSSFARQMRTLREAMQRFRE